MPAAASRGASNESRPAYPWAEAAKLRKWPKPSCGWPARRPATPAAHCWMSAADVRSAPLSGHCGRAWPYAPAVDSQQSIDSLAIVLPAQLGEERNGLRITAGQHGQPLLEAARGVAW